MWAALTTVSVGNFVVGVQSDTAKTARLVNAFLADYIDPDAAEGRTNYSLRRNRGLFRSGPGRFYIGGCLARESNNDVDLFSVLADQLAGVAAPDDHLARLEARVFAIGDRAVIVKAPHSQLPAVDGLGDAREVPMWQPRISAADRTIVSPPPLENLRWSALKASPPDRKHERYTIEGVICLGHLPLADQLRDLWARASGDLDGLRDCLGSLAIEGRTRATMKRQDVIDAVAELLA